MGKPHKLTPKQENFCWKYIETGNAHTAYIKSYDVDFLDKQKDWTYSEASNLLNNPKITQRIDEIKAEISVSTFINLDRILFELEQARMTAHAKKDVQGMVRATAEKARILDLGKLEKLNQQLDKKLEKLNDEN